MTHYGDKNKGVSPLRMSLDVAEERVREYARRNTGEKFVWKKIAAFSHYLFPIDPGDVGHGQRVECRNYLFGVYELEKKLIYEKMRGKK